MGVGLCLVGGWVVGVLLVCFSMIAGSRFVILYCLFYGFDFC